MASFQDTVDLADWRRRIADLYSRVRAGSDPETAWDLWVQTRQEMFVTHPQSPVPEEERAGFRIPMFEYDASFRVTGELGPTEPLRIEIQTSGESTMGFTRFAVVSFELRGEKLGLPIYWLDGYAGGLFLPLRDATSGKQTYGAGRYLFDAAKGADLGFDGGRLILDFNFAYPPSCSYDSRWSCPLAPPDNHLAVAVEAGEKTIR